MVLKKRKENVGTCEIQHVRAQHVPKKKMERLRARKKKENNILSKMVSGGNKCFPIKASNVV
jgi:hypothetical protein